MTLAIASIQVVKSSEGFVVYGRFGAMMRADSNKEVIYCNLNQEAVEYKKMVQRLINFKDQ